SPFHMPKDLFNAFPSQRGDLLSEITTAAADEPRKSLRAPLLKGSDRLWHAFQTKVLSPNQKEQILDSIDSFDTISFKAMLLAINTEVSPTIKAKLLQILFKKIKQEGPKAEFKAIKASVLALIKNENNSIVLTNALILSP